MIHLHVHSTFSFMDGFGTPDQIAKRAAELGAPAIALTDHGNVSGHVAFGKACQAAGVRPIFGVEMYTVEDVNHNQQRKGHMTILAMNDVGYKNLLQLMTLAESEGHYYYRPTVDIEDIMEYNEGLIVSTGCLYGLVPSLLRNGQDERAEDIVRAMQSVYDDRFFLEVQPFNLEDTTLVNKAMIALHEKTGAPLLATGDVHYPNPEDHDKQRSLTAIRMGVPLSQLDKFEDIMYQSTQEQMESWFAENHPYYSWTDAIAASDAIADRCWVDLPQAPPLRFSDEPTEARIAYFRKLINEGWVARGMDELDEAQQEVYKARVEREYELVVQKDFFDYYLVVGEIISWSKENNILCGAGRGSAAGSLLCYLMGITEIDPIPYDLIFERFIDVSREDPPDVDCDFEDRYREDVKQHMRDRYGDACVANLSAYVTFKGKNSLDDIARIEGIPAWEVAKIKGVLVERSSGDSRASFTIEDTCAEFPQAQDVLDRHPELKKAMALEGQIRGLTVHAAGMVVCNEPLTNFTAILKTGQTAINHKDAAKIGLLKIDILGISTLTIVHRCAETVGVSNEQLHRLPLDDPLVFEGFNAGYFKGIFQWEGRSTQSVTRQMSQKSGVTTFEQLVDINTLSRPGPLNSGATTKYVDEQFERLHPMLDKMTVSTRGQVLYQEQVMLIMREMGLMSWADTASIRKLISKKEGVERFNTYLEKFKKGAMSQGVSEDKVQVIWDRICTFGAYAFNKSHSVCYAMLAYQTMWLKMHYPVEFYWACLVHDPRDTGVVREAMKRGIEIKSVKIGKSKADWSIEDGALRAGFLSLKGVGEKTALKLEIPGYSPPEGVRKALVSAGAYAEDSKTDDFMGMRSFEDRLVKSGAKHKIGDLGYEGAQMVSVAGIIKERNLRSMEEYTRSILKSDKAIDHPELDQWVVLLVEDDTGYIHCNIDRYSYAKWKDEVWTEYEEGDIFVVKGTKTNGVRRIKVKSIQNWSKKNEPREMRNGRGAGNDETVQLELFATDASPSPVPRPRRDDGDSDTRKTRAVPSVG